MFTHLCRDSKKQCYHDKYLKGSRSSLFVCVLTTKHPLLTTEHPLCYKKKSITLKSHILCGWSAVVHEVTYSSLMYSNRKAVTASGATHIHG